MKNNPYKILLILGMFMLMVIPFSSAAVLTDPSTWDDSVKFHETSPNGKYGYYEIADTLLWIFNKKQIKTVELIENDYSLYEAWNIKQIEVFHPTKLFDRTDYFGRDKKTDKAEDIVSEQQLYREWNNEPIYETITECTEYNSYTIQNASNTTEITECVTYSESQIEVASGSWGEWKEYKWGSVQAGLYQTKTIVRRSNLGTGAIDWIDTNEGHQLKEWALWWDGNWQYRREISNLDGTISALYDIDLDPNMNSDFSDVRFIDSASNTKELNYSIIQYTNGSGLAYGDMDSGLTTSMVSYYKLDEASGTTATDSHGSLTLTEVGTSSVPNQAGKINTAWGFSYDSDRLQSSSNTGISGSSARSIFGWVKYDDDTNAGVMAGIGVASNSAEFAIGRNSGAGGKQVYLTGFLNDVTGNTQLNSGEWYHIGATYDGTTAKLYVNGQLDKSQIISLSTTNSKLLIGSRDGWSVGHAGDIDEVGLWSRELSSDEALEIYNAQSAKFRINNENETTVEMYYGNPSATTSTESFDDLYWSPVAGYTFDTGTANDDSSNGNDGTVDGATFTSSGYIDGAYDFESTISNNILLPSISMSTGYTLSAWIRAESFPEANYNFIIGLGENENGLSVTNSKVTAYHTNSAGGNDQLDFSTTINTGTWYMITSTWDGTTLSIYVNGDFKTSATKTTIETGKTSPSYIGAWIASSLFFDGLIDEVIIFNYDISTSQISYLYETTKPAFVVGAEEAASGVTIAQLTPEINEKLTDTAVNFTYNISVTGTEFANTTMWVYNSTDDALLVTNQSTLSGNTSQIITYANNLSDGEFKWSAEVCDNAGTCGTTSNRTFFIDTTPPEINITAPVGTLEQITIGDNETLNYTITEANTLQECWFEYNETEIILPIDNSTDPLVFGTNYANVTAVRDSNVEFSSIPESCSRNGNFTLTSTTSGFFDHQWLCLAENGSNVEIGISNFPPQPSTNITAMKKQPLNCLENTTEFEYVLGKNGLCVHAIDEFGLHTEATTTWDYAFTERNVTFNNETLEGSNQNFIFEFDKGSSKQVSKVELFFNGNVETMISSTTGNEVTATTSFVIPSVTADTNKTLYFKVTYTDSTEFTTENYTMLVKNIAIDDCSSYTTKLLNFTLLDEKEETNFTGGSESSEMEVDVIVKPVGVDENILRFSQKFEDKNPVLICISSDLDGDSFDIDATVRYLGDDHAIEYYNLQGYEVTSTNIPKNVTLLDLSLNDSVEFQITFRDENGLFVEGAVVGMYRQYVSQGEFKLVEAPKTDSNGQTVVHLDEKNIVYNIIVTKDGEVLATFNNVIPFCEDLTTGLCQINLVASEALEDFFSYNNIFKIEYTPSFNSTTRILNFDYTARDLESKDVEIIVKKFDMLGATQVTNSSITAASGTIQIDLPAPVGNGTFLASVYVDGELMETFEMTTDEDMPYGTFGHFGFFILLLTLLIMLSDSKTMLILGSVVGFIFASWNGIISYTQNGTGNILWSMAWLIVAAGIMIYKLNKKGQGSN